MEFKDFLSKFGERAGSDVDIALLNLLKQYKNDIEPIYVQANDRFHKMFRILTIVNPGVDAAIWHLLNESSAFWGAWAESLKDKGE